MVQAGRERDFANLYRANDARSATSPDEDFALVLKFVGAAFDMTVGFLMRRKRAARNRRGRDLADGSPEKRRTPRPLSAFPRSARGRTIPKMALRTQRLAQSGSPLITRPLLSSGGLPHFPC